MIRDQRLVRFAREWASLMVSAEEGEPTATNATELEKRTPRITDHERIFTLRAMRTRGALPRQ